MTPAILAWMLLLGAPALGLGLHLAVMDGLSTRRRVLVVSLLMAAVGLVILAAAWGVRFISLVANIVVLAAAYAAYVAAALSLSSMRRSVVARRVVLVVALTPVAFGYFLGTVGALGLLFVVGEFEDGVKATRLAPGLVCIRTNGGGPSGGYALRIHREWPLVPVIHREVRTLAFREEGEGPATCDALSEPPL